MLREFVNEFPEFPVAIGEAHNLPPERVAELLDERAERMRAFADLLDNGLRHIAAKGVAHVSLPSRSSAIVRSSQSSSAATRARV